MPTVTAQHVELDLTLDQVVAIVLQLEPQERERVRQAIAPPPWSQRLDALLARVWSRVEHQPIAEEDVNAKVERAEMVEPTIHVALCRDPKDDIFLDAAIAGQVTHLVTGDDDLKGDRALKDKLRDEHGIQIMGVPEFLAILAAIE